MMSKILRFVCLLFFPLGFLPSFSCADMADVYLRLGVSIEDFGYKEFDKQDVLLDREDGLLPGLTMVLGKHWQDISGVLRFELINGVVDYNGQTQSGIPLTTETAERIRTFEGLLRLKLKALPQHNTSLIAGIGHREWRRSIYGTSTVSGLFEVYRWKYLIVGGAVTLWKKGKWSAGVDVRWLRPIHPTLAVDLVGYDEVTLDMKSRSSARMNFPIQFYSANEQEWTITPYWESWRLGRSDDERLTINGVPTAVTANEPRSETNIYGVTVSVKF